MQNPKKSAKGKRTASEERPPPRLITDLVDTIVSKLCTAEKGVTEHEMLTREAYVLSKFEMAMGNCESDTSVALHKAFANWAEWEAVVLSMLKAWAYSKSHAGLPFGAEPLSAELTGRGITTRWASAKCGLDAFEWKEVFNLLKGKKDADPKKKGRVDPYTAQLFFKRVDDARRSEEAKTRRNQCGDDEGWISQWVNLQAKPDEFPGLCALDNGSIARFLKWPDDSSPNVSRVLRPFKLTRCSGQKWGVPKVEKGGKTGRIPAPVKDNK